MTKIAVVGVGQMGSAIIKGLSNLATNTIIGENPVNPRVDTLAKQYKFTLVNKLDELVNLHPEVVILTTPASLTLQIASNLQNLSANCLFISAAAGISYEQLNQVLPHHQIVRIIPNTPVAINAGTIGLFLPDNLTENSKKLTYEVLEPLGDVITVKEDQFSIVGTIGGCGPAFVDVFLDALGDAGVLNGISRSLANELAASMVKGAASLAYETKTSPALLKDQVCSPGGTTIKGVVSLEKDGFQNAIINAINSANQN